MLKLSIFRFSKGENLKLRSLITAGAAIAATMVLAGGQVLAEPSLDDAIDIAYGEVVHVTITSDINDFEMYRFDALATGTYTFLASNFDHEKDDVFVVITDSEGNDLGYIVWETYQKAFVKIQLEEGKTYYIFASKDGDTTSADYNLSITGYKGEGNPRRTGWWQKGDECYYYSEYGIPIVSKWVNDGGKWYYFDVEGVMQTGWICVGTSYYYMKSNGAMATGWQKIDDNWFFFTPSGVRVDGWKQFGNTWYFFYADGRMCCDGILQLDGKSYYFDETGAMQTGWVFNKKNSKWYYFESNGVGALNWKQIDGKWYFFLWNSIMDTGWHTEDDAKYYLDEKSGAMVTGWQKIDNSWYFFKSSGAMVTDWQMINGKWYYFNFQSGIMATGWHYDKGMTKYYLKSSGEMATGWLKIDNCWYYFESSGIMVTGDKKINGKMYHFDNWGVCSNP